MLPRTIVSVIDSLDATTHVALAWALSVARWYESDLHVVHVSRSRRRSGAVEGARRDELAARLNRIVETSEPAGVDVTPVVLSGKPVRAIADYSRRVAADLVVVTNGPRRGSGYWSTGSFAAALAKAVAARTIVLPNTDLPAVEPSGLFRNIVTGIDFSEVSYRALSEALDLAQLSGGHLKLVHVMSGFPYETVYGGVGASRLRPYLSASASRISRELRLLIPSDALNWSEIATSAVAGQAPEGILATATRARADLIVLGMPRRSRLGELLTGSTVRRVLGGATSPVLLVPGPAAPPRLLVTEERRLRLAPSLFGARGVTGMDAPASWR
jgi:nucleotide-binding universal stress UspA family protein